MSTQVKVVVDKLDESTLNKVREYANRLERLLFITPEVTILDPNYSANYPKSNQYQQQLMRMYPKFKIKNFYLDAYSVNNERGNAERFVNEELGKRKVVKEESADGTILFKEGNHILVALKKGKEGRATAIDFAHKGHKKPYQRVSVNEDRNVQTIRIFNEDTNLPTEEYYVDSDLQPFLSVQFNEKGLREHYSLLKPQLPIVDSELDLYDQWFAMEICADDYVINLNKTFNVLFEEYEQLERIFLV